jgi:signal peptidase I
MQRISNLDQFPKDLNVNNTMTDFQRFQIPKKGQRIAINSQNIAWYKRIISAYEGHELTIKGDQIYIDGKRATSYRFAMNYYWMMGDNRFHSADSRVWGFVPEDHIVGRASFIWFSKSPFVDSFLGIRFDRIFHFVV